MERLRQDTNAEIRSPQGEIDLRGSSMPDSLSDTPALFGPLYEKLIHDSPYATENLVFALGFMAEHNRKPLQFREDKLTIKDEPLQASYISLLKFMALAGFEDSKGMPDSSTPKAFVDLYKWFSTGTSENFYELLFTAADVKQQVLSNPTYMYPAERINGAVNPMRRAVDYVDGKIRWRSVEYLRALASDAFRNNQQLPVDHFDHEILIAYAARVKNWHHPPASEELVHVNEVSRYDFTFRQWFGNEILRIATEDRLMAQAAVYSS
jgi:hypothetical protein